MINYETLMKQPSAEMAEGMLGMDLWPTQRQIMDAVDMPDKTIIATASCHSAGKTVTAAALILTFLIKNPFSLVLATAPTQRQVEKQVFMELRELYKRVEHLFPKSEMLTAELRLDNKWGCVGFTTKDPEKFQGWHRDKILILVDEGSGVKSDIYNSIESAMTSGDVKLVIMSNPTRSTGYYADLFRNPPNSSELIRISCFDTPNFLINNITTVRQLKNADINKLQVANPSALSIRWCQDRLQRWGENSMWFKIRILGQFAESDSDSLFKIDDIYSAINNSTLRYEKNDQIIVGIDPSGYGDDRFACLLQRAKIVCDYLVEHGKIDPRIMVGKIVNWLKAYPKKKIKIHIDTGGGYGGEYVSRLREAGFEVVEVNSSHEPSDKKTYLNLRAENYHKTEWRFRNNEIAIRLPKEIEDDLVADLLATKYKNNEARGVVQIVSKEDIKKLTGGTSPDLADALMVIAGTPDKRYVRRGVIAI